MIKDINDTLFKNIPEAEIILRKLRDDLFCRRRHEGLG